MLSVFFDSLAPARLALRANLRLLYLQGPAFSIVVNSAGQNWKYKNGTNSTRMNKIPTSTAKVKSTAASTGFRTNQRPLPSRCETTKNPPPAAPTPASRGNFWPGRPLRSPHSRAPQRPAPYPRTIPPGTAPSKASQTPESTPKPA